MPADADAKCCCAWGAAIGARGLGVRYAEYPEFGCAKCPVHQAALGETELCRRHKKEDQSMEISDRWYPHV